MTDYNIIPFPRPTHGADPGALPAGQGQRRPPSALADHCWRERAVRLAIARAEQDDVLAEAMRLARLHQMHRHVAGALPPYAHLHNGWMSSRQLHNMSMALAILALVGLVSVLFRIGQIFGRW